MTSPKSNKKSHNAISKTINNSDPLSSLKIKLKSADSEIQNYVTALESENLKFQRKIGNLQADIVSLINRITILDEKVNEKTNMAAMVAAVLSKKEHDKPPKS